MIVSALSTVWITHETRLLTITQDKLIRENTKLDNQYIHLELEENSLSEKNRIEAISVKFDLQPVKKEQEIILVE